MGVRPLNPTLYDEPGLLERLRSGDRRAQAAVFEAEHRRLGQLASRLAGSADVEALVADLLTDFFFKFVHEVRSVRAIPAYLRIMTVRRATRLRARDARREDVPGPAQEAGAPGLEQAVEQQTYLRWLETCLDGLTVRARTVLKLQYGHDLSLAQAGAHLGCSKQAVGKMAQKSLEVLRRCMETREAGARA